MNDHINYDLYGTPEFEQTEATIYPGIYAHRPTLRILVYTDSARENFSSTSGYGFSSMLRLLAANNPFYADIQFTNINRHEGGVSGARKLTNDAVNLYQYDEIWFFCRGQRNITRADWFNGNFPDSELTDDEVDLLWDYMNYGGVLIAGDHANPDPINPGGLLLNLGRAVGARIPRAGKLRRWEGGPGPDDDRYDTVRPPGSELDATPQRINLTYYPRGTRVSELYAASHPHPIFCGRNGPIEILPDHMHEGHLTIPTSFNEAEWPRAGSLQPRPEVIARGVNNVNGRPIDLVAAYDGAVAGVGRVVADSTWHHYQNDNLNGMADSEHGRTLGNYYANLAVWLAPFEKREQMRHRFYWRLVTHPYMVEFGRQSAYAVGREALNVLGDSVSVCEIYQMFSLSPSPSYNANQLPPIELCLGSILKAYHKQLFYPSAQVYDKPERIIRRGLGKSLKHQIAATDSYVKQLRGLHKQLNLENEDVQTGEGG
jgi:hypothetical protein